MDRVGQVTIEANVSAEELSLLQAYRESAKQPGGAHRQQFIAHYARIASAHRDRRSARAAERWHASIYRRQFAEQLAPGELELIGQFRKCTRRRRSAIVSYAEIHAGWREPLAAA
jgi:hypothetical protein